MPKVPWDLFCRVVDNLGDVGVCWRLAADLADRGQPVRLWLDDARALAWMAPDRASRYPAIEVLDWTRAERAPEPGAAVIEAFGCDPPPAFVARMAAQRRPPVWINLEYLSAEAHVERSHGLPSPQFSGPGTGLRKSFFFPGFTPATGGLLREPGLLAQRARFDAPAWLAAQGWPLNAGEQAVSLFCYPQAPVGALIDLFAEQPTLLLAAAGQASEAVRRALGPSLRRGALRAITLPWLSQPDFDRLLWACAINWVRGEDSAVRAQWAGRPFVWQFYPQSDGADALKAQAFLDRFIPCAGHAAAPAWAGSLRALWQGWNGWAPLPATRSSSLPPLADWTRHCEAWCDHLATQRDLASQLQDFVREAS